MKTTSRRALAIWPALIVAAALSLLAAGLAGAGTTVTRAGQTLVVLEDDIAPALDPDGPSSAHPGTEEINANTMDTLLEYPSTLKNGILIPNYRATTQRLVPRLATSWKRTGATWTFTLRKGAKSCAGNELTADDVVWTFARAKSVSGAAPVAWFLGNVMGILPLDPLISKDPKAKELNGEVTKAGRYSVRFKPQHPSELFPKFLQIFALGIFDSAELKKHATARDPWAHNYTLTQNSPGFGAYCLTRWNKGSEMNLESNPNYWQGTPKYTKIVIRKVPQDSNRLAAIRSNSAQIVTQLTPEEIANVKKDPSISVLEWFNTEQLSLGLNYAYAPWNLPGNALLRQAIAYALPYNEIIANDYRGDARPWLGLIPSSFIGYKKIDRYRTNVAKAKQLLARAGFPGGKGLEKYSSALTLSYAAERSTVNEPIGNRIRTALAQIGINITLAPIPLAQFTDRTLTKRDMPMFLNDAVRSFGPDAGYSALLFFVSVKKGGLINPGQYSSAKVDALYAASATQVGARRAKTLNTMQDILANDLPVIPIAERPSIITVRKGISNWAGRSDNVITFFYLK